MARPQTNNILISPLKSAKTLYTSEFVTGIGKTWKKSKNINREKKYFNSQDKKDIKKVGTTSILIIIYL